MNPTAGERSRGSEKIRILYCIDAMARGGTENQLAALIRGLDRRRFEPLLSTLRPSTMALSELECETIHLALGSFAAPSAVSRLIQLRRFIVGRRVDIVQTFFQDSTLAGMCASVGTPVRRIACFRDLGFWRSARALWTLRLAYRGFDSFTANAQAVARHVHEVDGIPLSKIEVIYNGVTMPSVPHDHAVQGPPIVGVVANLNRRVKRVDLFLEAARLVHRDVPEAAFVIVGDGALRPELEALAARLGIADAVRFAGPVDDASPYVASFDVGVLPSDSEGLSNAILEYMAAGVPTVARRVGGNGELVIDGVTGFLVESADGADLAKAIVRLLKDRELRGRLGRASRETAGRRYSLETYVELYQNYYARLLRELPRVPVARSGTEHRFLRRPN
jgi:glycosyltransferase involved in cell wall biosynthesis